MDEYLTRPEAAAMLRISTGTLANWCWRGTGPKPIRPSGGKTLYRRSDVERWLKSYG